MLTSKCRHRALMAVKVFICMPNICFMNIVRAVATCPERAEELGKIMKSSFMRSLVLTLMPSSDNLIAELDLSPMPPGVIGTAPVITNPSAGDVHGHSGSGIQPSRI